MKQRKCLRPEQERMSMKNLIRTVMIVKESEEKLVFFFFPFFRPFNLTISTKSYIFFCEKRN